MGFYKPKVISQEYGVTTIETPPCVICHETSVVEVSDEGYWKWVGGTLIQYAFPYLPVGQCELLISGTHDECWDILNPEEWNELVPEEEDDNDE